MFKVNEELVAFPHISKSSPTALVGSPNCTFNLGVLRKEGVNATPLLSKNSLTLIQSSALLRSTVSCVKNIFIHYCISNKTF